MYLQPSKLCNIVVVVVVAVAVAVAVAVVVAVVIVMEVEGVKVIYLQPVPHLQPPEKFRLKPL